jgi:hypothetical protein
VYNLNKQFVFLDPLFGNESSGEGGKFKTIKAKSYHLCRSHDEVMCNLWKIYEGLLP